MNDFRKLAEKLFRECRQAMYITAFSVLREPHDAEDTVHEAFARVFSAPEKLLAVDPEKRRSYLTIITRNIAVDIIRSRKKQEPLEDEDTLPDIPPDGELSGVEREVFAGFDTERIAQALRSLPESQRELLILRHFHELTLNDIAAALDIGADAAKKRLYRAEKALRALLKEEEL